MTRPTKYKNDFARQAYLLCCLGAIDLELSAFFKVSESTLNLWKQKHPSFFIMLQKGKAVTDSKVEQQLKQLAIGYYHPCSHILNHQGKIHVIQTTKHYPPNVKACSFWLKNRAAQRWAVNAQQSEQIKLPAQVIR